MKTLFVSDLTTEQSITTFFLVHAKEIRNTKEGKPYLRMELGDRSGTLEARMWTKFELPAQDISRDDFVKVEGRIELYRDKPQLAILQLRKAKPEEIELGDYLPHTKEDVEKMYADLIDYAGSIKNPWLPGAGNSDGPINRHPLQEGSRGKNNASRLSWRAAGTRGWPVRSF